MMIFQPQCRPLPDGTAVFCRKSQISKEFHAKIHIFFTFCLQCAKPWRTMIKNGISVIHGRGLMLFENRIGLRFRYLRQSAAAARKGWIVHLTGIWHSTHGPFAKRAESGFTPRRWMDEQKTAFGLYGGFSAAGGRAADFRVYGDPAMRLCPKHRGSCHEPGYPVRRCDPPAGVR